MLAPAHVPTVPEGEMASRNSGQVENRSALSKLLRQVRVLSGYRDCDTLHRSVSPYPPDRHPPAPVTGKGVIWKIDM